MNFIARECRAADLVIVGANKSGAILDTSLDLDPGDFLMQAGRPVLVVPPEVESLKAETIVIGWKESREARRAVLDALPLLQACRSAIVAEVDEIGDSAAALDHVEDVAVWLRRHGIEADTAIIPATQDAALHLDTLAWGEGADLIIAGGYGHSRFREWFLGGVTRDLLTKTPRCSLMSH